MKLRSVLETARAEYETAAAAAPDLFEARLRLGRVLWRLGQPEKARGHFEWVIASTAHAGFRYLAHLFLGRVHEDRSRWIEAEQQYRAAIDLQPGSEVAAVALSHVRFLQGDTESAREILAASLERVRSPVGVDPWVSYLVIQVPEGEGILANLGRGLRP
jgi:tetratricopeptide (TPR) repeat protein